jgi:hypothetical protein
MDSEGIGIFLGNGDGTFTLKTSLPGGGDQLMAVELTGSGNLDLVTPGQIFLGNGDGTFNQAPPLSMGGEAVAAADFNGDGIPDLAISDSSDAIVLFYFGNGDGTFGPPSVYRAISGQTLLAGDFNHDGIPDLAVGSGDVRILLGKGDGTFTLQIPHIVETVQQSPYRPLIEADFNGDGRPDLGLVYGTAVIDVPVVMAILNTSN